jgi:acyl carrier protein
VDNILEKLQEIIRGFTDNQDFILTADMVLRTDLEINSFEFVQIICELEEALDVQIPDRAIMGFKTVGDVVAWLHSEKPVNQETATT